jgi:hypothetical protein
MRQFDSAVGGFLGPATVIQATGGDVGRVDSHAARDVCLSAAEAQGGQARYAMVDFGMAAFSSFFMQCPSFLAHQRLLERGAGHGRSNCETLLEMTGIPCDNQIRTMLDPVEPAYFFPVFDAAFRVMEKCGGLDTFRQLGGYIPIALDGTEYFCSNKISCCNCST